MMCRALLAAYHGQRRTPINATNSTVIAMPRQQRLAIFGRLTEIAASKGLTVRVCACKNPDLPAGPCSIAAPHLSDRRSKQLELFAGR